MMNPRFSLGGARGSSGIPGRIPVSDSSASFITEMLSPIPVSDTYYFCQSLRCLCVDSLDASGTRLDGFISVVQRLDKTAPEFYLLHLKPASVANWQNLHCKLLHLLVCAGKIAF
jgi:hypothetical protein